MSQSGRRSCDCAGAPGAFARSGPDKFDSNYLLAERGTARLLGSAAWITTMVDDYVTAGDRTVLLTHSVTGEPGTECHGCWPTKRSSITERNYVRRAWIDPGLWRSLRRGGDLMVLEGKNPFVLLGSSSRAGWRGSGVANA
ncbi:hypothetical protein ABZ798_02355 [Streptomyces sp. NPDC047803]|uniref:hypothetical protein n=1 Tax=Streptomyces sp. NPDC047803 TaxID=3160976 RepID=UPI0033FD4EAF